MLSALQQRSACGYHFLNGSVPLAPVGQTETEMVDVAGSTRCVGALLKGYGVMGAGRSQKDHARTVPKQLLQADTRW